MTGSGRWTAGAPAWERHGVLAVLSSPYLMIAPVVGLFLVFLAYPVGFAAYVSMHDWSGAGPIGDFVRLDNYVRIGQDPVFRRSLANTLMLAVGASLLQVGGAVAIGTLLYSLNWGKLIFRTVFFLPCVMSLIAVGLLWNWIYHPTFGLLNAFLSAVGLPELERIWLGDTRLALPSVLVAYSWQWTGVFLLIIIAGMQNIRPSFYEIAELEGARWYHRLFYVTIPSLRPQIYICLMLCLVFSLRLFPLVYIMTQGGPAYASEVLGLTIYRYGFSFQEMDRAAAMSVVIVAITFGASSLYTRLLKRGPEGVGE